ncbi:FAR1 domain-containing protein [Entamoeba marina]
MNPFHRFPPYQQPPPSSQQQFPPPTSNSQHDSAFFQERNNHPQPPLHSPHQQNTFASPVRYLTLQSDVPSQYPYPPDRGRQPYPNPPQQSFYYQRTSPPPPPVTTVHRDYYDYPQQRQLYSYSPQRGRTMSPQEEPFYSQPRSFSFDRTVFKRSASPDFGSKREYDPYLFKHNSTLHSPMSDDSEFHPLQIPRATPENKVLQTAEYNGVREFESMEAAIATLTAWAETQNVILRKGSGNNKTMKDGTRKKVVLVCQCSGKYRSCSYSPRGSSNGNSSGDEGQRVVKKRRSKKTECPFRINLNYRAKSNTWNITKMILEHNH